jgi:long-chain fatty acid transport protein
MRFGADIMKRLAMVVLVAALPSAARAGGFEILEQSPAGVSMAGAQSAAVRDPGAVFYNPAALTHQRGLGILLGVNVIRADTKASLESGGMTKEWSSPVTRPAPFLYISQRIGARFAVGLGAFANFGLSQDWPADGSFGGRFVGVKFQLTTFTINPVLAIRVLPWLSFGFGLTLTPAAVELKRSLNFGSTEGQVHTGMDAFGVGANLATLVRVVPKYLDFAFTYRSAVELNFSGEAALTVPPELASAAAAMQNAKASVTLPHNMTFGFASRPIPALTLALDIHAVLWSVVDRLTLELSDPKAPPGTMPTRQGQALNFRDSVGLRFGVQWRALQERMPVRVGIGWDRTPTPEETMSPLGPDADRIFVGAGIGYHWKWVGFDVGYLAIVLPSRASKLSDFPATYSSLGHVVTVGLSFHGDDVGGRINDPAYKN